MNIAIVGCGYVADFYMTSIGYHPALTVVGAFDVDRQRLSTFCDYFSVQAYDSIDTLLADSKVEMVLNLTNPRSHYEVTKQCMEAGKHVYSEKPLAMEFESAQELVELASERSLYLGSAPCNGLSETAQTVWKALREGVIGPVRLVYASFDAGMTHKFKPWNWKSVSGAPWPAKDEFEVGCTYQHAGYFLTWLAAFFGPAKRVTAFSSCQLPDKGIKVDVQTPDFSDGCIEYANGVVARVTCSIIAPVDKSLTIVGDEGLIYVKDLRDDASPVYVKKIPPGRLEGALEYRLDYWQTRVERLLNRLPWSWGNYWRIKRKFPYVVKPEPRSSGSYKPVDFCRGVAEMAEAIGEGRPSRMSAALALHVTELIEALQYPERFDNRLTVRSRFDSIEPYWK